MGFELWSVQAKYYYDKFNEDFILHRLTFREMTHYRDSYYRHLFNKKVSSGLGTDVGGLVIIDVVGGVVDVVVVFSPSFQEFHAYNI